jgi:hypothetical protein
MIGGYYEQGLANMKAIVEMPPKENPSDGSI